MNILMYKLFRMLRDTLLDVWRKRETNKLFTLFVLLVESGTLYVAMLVSTKRSIVKYMH